MDATISPMLGTAFLVNTIASIGVLVCFIMVVVKMFQNKDTTWAVVSLISFFCCLGALLNINFVVGWVRARQWNMKKLMYVYTAFFALYVVSFLITGPAFMKMYIDMVQQTMKEVEKQQQRNTDGPPPIQVEPIPAPEGGPVPQPEPIDNP